MKIYIIMKIENDLKITDKLVFGTWKKWLISIRD